MLQEISPDLENFGHRVATDIHSMGNECELQPPRLEYFDHGAKEWTISRHVKDGSNYMMLQLKKD